MMMEEQLERSRVETEGIWKMKEKVEGVLVGLGGGEGGLGLEDGKAMTGEGVKGRREMEKYKRVWEVLESEVGL